MSDDLDKLEAIAKAAQGESGDWFVDKLMTDECRALGNSEPHPFEGYRIHATDGTVLECATLNSEDAQHIASFSPDVVLRLIARVREAEKATRLAVKYAFDLRYAYEDSHIHSIERELEKLGGKP